MRISMTTAAIMLALASPVAAHAELINEGNYALDTTTGLDWLDPALTLGLSYNQVSAGAGGWTTSGWQFATNVQFAALGHSYVAPMPESWVQSNYAGGLALVTAIGATTDRYYETPIPLERDNSYYDHFLDTQGLLSSGTIPILAEVYIHTGYYTDYLGQPTCTCNAGWGITQWDIGTLDRPLVGVGSFLVRTDPSAPTDVPEPASALILAAGLGAIGMVRCRRLAQRFTPV